MQAQLTMNSYRSGFVDICLKNAPYEARIWYDQLEELCQTVIKNNAREVDEKGIYPRASIAALRKIRAFGVAAPETYGGLDFGTAMAALVVETVAAACPSTAAILMFHFQVVNRVLNFGNAKLKREDLPKLVSGEWMGGSAWSELSSGADKSNIATHIHAEAGRKVVNGEKHFCTGLEGLSVIHVLLDGDHENENSLAPTFVRIRTAAEGVRLTPMKKLLGLRGSSTGTISLEAVAIDDDDIIDSIGSGPKLMRSNHEVLMNPGLIALGISRAAFEEVKKAVNGQWEGMRNTSNYQNTRFAVSNMEIRMSATYALATQTLKCIENKAPNLHIECSKVKVYATETASNITSTCMQLVGARGFVGDWPIEKYFRDARATLLMGPSNEIIREWIFKSNVS